MLNIAVICVYIFLQVEFSIMHKIFLRYPLKRPLHLQSPLYQGSLV